VSGGTLSVARPTTCGDPVESTSAGQQVCLYPSYTATVISTLSLTAYLSSTGIITTIRDCQQGKREAYGLEKRQSLRCNADNCLRQIQNSRVSFSARQFCMTYTITVNTDTAAIPTYLGNCRQDPARVSLACSCLVAAATTTSTTTSTTTTAPSTSTTLSTTTISTSTTTLTTTRSSSSSSSRAQTTCRADNCLRNLQNTRSSSSVSAFCATYTAALMTDPAAIPTYLGNCG
jgi:hypothetical protein